MSSYNQQSYAPPGEGAPAASKNSFRKGLGFVPNTLRRSSHDPIALLLKSAPAIPKGIGCYSEKASILYESGATIPLFDIERIAMAEGKERKQLIHSFGNAIKQVGFLGIKAFNLSSLIDTLYEEMSRYFQQPLEAKLQDWNKYETQRGYCYRGHERGPRAPRPDFKESFFITPDFNKWPSTCRALPRIASEYHSILMEVHKYLISFLMEYLGEDSSPMENDYAEHLLRLAYYPAFKPGDDPEGIWSAPHKDQSALSIYSRATVPGLQFYSSNGIWEPVVVPERHLIVTPGLLLQYKTAGLIRARWHRVHNPGGKFTRLHRMSTALYGTLPDSYSLRPFDDCMRQATRGMTPSRQKEFRKKFPDITVGEELSRRSVAAFVKA